MPFRRDGDEVFSQAGLSRVLNVMYSETGQYATYAADEHGFNSPEGLWPGQIDVALLGDSCGQGAVAALNDVVVVNLYEHLVRRPDVVDLYSDPGSHFNAKGYEVATGVILERIRPPVASSNDTPIFGDAFHAAVAR